MSNKESIQEPPGFENRPMLRLSLDSINCPLVNEGIQTEEHNPEPVEAQDFKSASIDQASRVPKPKPSKVPKNCEQSKYPKNPQCSKGNSEDSIQKIAREALHIGKILGITVVQNEKATTARITDSLKKCKKPLKQKGTSKSKKGTQQ